MSIESQQSQQPDESPPTHKQSKQKTIQVLKHRLKEVLIDGPEGATPHYFVVGFIAGFGVVVVPGYLVLTNLFK